jgi:hypothetical protein
MIEQYYVCLYGSFMQKKATKRRARINTKQRTHDEGKREEK